MQPHIKLHFQLSNRQRGVCAVCAVCAVLCVCLCVEGVKGMRRACAHMCLTCMARVV